MKQKLALACTLVHEPRSCCPRRADDRRRSGVAARVLEAAVGVPVARPHHRHGDAVSRRSGALRRVALLHEGRLLALDAPAALQATLAGRLIEVIAATPRPPVDVLAALPGVEDVQTFGDRAHVRLRTGHAGRGYRRGSTAALGERGSPSSARGRSPASLEDVFIDLDYEEPRDDVTTR